VAAGRQHDIAIGLEIHPGALLQFDLQCPSWVLEVPMFATAAAAIAPGRHQRAACRFERHDPRISVVSRVNVDDHSLVHAAGHPDVGCGPCGPPLGHLRHIVAGIFVAIGRSGMLAGARTCAVATGAGAVFDTVAGKYL